LAWFPFYVDDFLGGTITLSDTETGRYLWCLAAQWSSGDRCAIPNNSDRLRTICRGSDPGSEVLSKFEKVTIDGEEYLRNERLAEEWRKAQTEYSTKKLAAERTNKRNAERDAEQGYNPQPTTYNLQPTKYKTEVDIVFKYWQEVMGHSGARLVAKRTRAISDRLREGYTVDQLKLAIDGCKASEWHQGKNDAGTVYDEITLICRDGPKVEDFIKRAQKANPGVNPNGVLYPPRRS
jgi:uncharacterized protein YdaU (DUF1376 family)